MERMPLWIAIRKFPFRLSVCYRMECFKLIPTTRVKCPLINFIIPQCLLIWLISCSTTSLSIKNVNSVIFKVNTYKLFQSFWWRNDIKNMLLSFKLLQLKMYWFPFENINKTQRQCGSFISYLLIALFCQTNARGMLVIAIVNLSTIHCWCSMYFPGYKWNAKYGFWGSTAGSDGGHKIHTAGSDVLLFIGISFHFIFIPFSKYL